MAGPPKDVHSVAMRTPHQKLKDAGTRLLRRPEGWRKDLTRHRDVLKMLRSGWTLKAACEKTGLSRQTIWRLLKKRKWPQRHGGRRIGCCKIPQTLMPLIKDWMWIYSHDHEPKRIGPTMVRWLRDEKGITVTPAAIYSLRHRLRKKNRPKSAVKQGTTKAPNQHKTAWPEDLDAV